jgi:hypothetical protein
MIPILVLLWIACGALSVGVGMGYSKGQYPSLWHEYYRSTLIMEILLALTTAPMSLFVNFTFNHGRYGLAYRRYSKEDKLRLVEQKLDKE